MKIQELGTEITDVPGIQFIRVEPQDQSERGVHVTIKLYSMDDPISFGVTEFGAFLEAMQFANERVNWLANHQGNL